MHGICLANESLERVRCTSQRIQNRCWLAVSRDGDVHRFNRDVETVEQALPILLSSMAGPRKRRDTGQG